MSDIAKVVGERLKHYRKKAALSQEALAEKAGLHYTYIGQLERGEKNATLESIEKVAMALTIPLEVLLKNVAASNEEDRIASECYNRILLLPQKEQEAVSDIIERVLEFRA
jgi:transcriptional regulator with XRE-family HTH domain